MTGITDMSVGLEESSNPEQQAIDLQPLVHHVQDRFRRSKDRRNQDERRWLEAYRNYRGIYSDDVAFTDTEQSQVFIKVTKTKVMAAYAQIGDVLFAGNKFPIGIEATPVPIGEGTSDFHIEFETRAEDPKSSTALTTRPELASFLKSSIERVDAKQVKHYFN